MPIQSRRARRALATGTIGLAAAGGVAAAALAADGRPDPTFAGGAPAAYVPGSLSPFDQSFLPPELRAATTPSGGAVVAASNPGSGAARAARIDILRGPFVGDISVARLTGAGVPDPAFGDDEPSFPGADGVLSITGGGTPLAVRSLASGTIRVLAVQPFSADVTVYDVDAAGTTSTATPVPTPEGCSEPAATTIDPSGRVVIAWRCAGPGYVLRSVLGPAGDPLAGGVTVAGGDVTDAVAVGLAVLTSGRIFLAEGSEGTGLSYLRVLDATGTANAITLREGDEGLTITGVGQAADGRVAVAARVAGEPPRWNAAVLDASGAFDANYGGGFLTIPAGVDATPTAATPRPGGGVVVQGVDSATGGPVLVGYTSTGELDATYGDAGVARYDASADPAISDEDPVNDSGPAVGYAGGALGVPLAALRQSFDRSAARAAAPVGAPVLGFLKRTDATTTTTTTTPTTPTTTTTTTTTGTTPTTPTTTTTETTPTAPVTPPASSGFAPSTGTPPAGGAAPATAAGGLRFCESRRRFTIRLGRNVPKRVLKQVVKAEVTVAGKRVKVTKDARLKARVVLRTRPYGRFTVRVKLTLRSGRTITDVRRYRTCRVRASDKPARTVDGVPAT